jgi:hypothetical protein
MGTATKDALSTQITKMETAAEDRLLKPSELGGRVRVVRFDHTFDGALAAGKYVILAKIPKNSIILNGVLRTDALVATADGDLGVIPVSSLDDTNADVLLDGVDVATGGIFTFWTGTNAAPNASGFEVTEESYIALKLVTAGAADADVIDGHALIAVES